MLIYYSSFFDNIKNRFLDPNYIPTQDDVLRTRIRSTGINEAEFKFVDMQFKLIDVGGQRAERKKWIHCFQSVITAIIFCASLNEYDQVLREDNDTNRMEESIALFKEIATSPFFKGIPMFLLLTKLDLFLEKIRRIDLTVCRAFKNYEGGNDQAKALEFIKNKFTFHSQNRDVYAHPTVAVDTGNVNIVFRGVRRSLLEKLLGNDLAIL